MAKAKGFTAHLIICRSAHIHFRQKEPEPHEEAPDWISGRLRKANILAIPAEHPRMAL